MKRIIGLLLTLFVLSVVLISCNSSNSVEGVQEEASVTNENISVEIDWSGLTDKQITQTQNLLDLGILSEELLLDFDADISKKDFAQLLMNANDHFYGNGYSGVLNYYGRTSHDYEAANRFDAAMMIFDSQIEFAFQLDFQNINQFRADQEELFSMENSFWKWQPLSSVIMEKEDGTVGMFGVYESKDITKFEHMGGNPSAIDYVTLAFNRLTDERIMTYFTDRTFRPDETLSVSDAVSITYNYYYSLIPETQYVNVVDVGVYNPEIITDELLEHETDLPDATNEQLPAWKGVNLQYLGTMAGSGEEANYWITEAQIKSMSDMGVNFLRLWISFAGFEGPDYEDRNVVNMYYLEHLDQIVAWCIEYDIHIQFSVSSGPGLDRNTFPPELENELTFRIFTDQAYREQFTQWYRMLARRYAAIPNKYTSINLMNEPMPLDDENYAETFSPIIDAIWEEAPDRVIVADVHMNATGEAMAKLGVALSCHTYEPQEVFVVTRDNGPAPYVNATWPLYYMNGTIFSKSWGSIEDNTDGLTIDGNISGTMEIMISDISLGAAILQITADNQVIYEQVPEYVVMGDNIEEDICYTEEPVTISIPEGIEEIKLNCLDGALTFSSIVIERDNDVPTFIAFNRSNKLGPAPDRISINDDGSYLSESVMLDAEMVINTEFGFPAIMATKKIADEYGVGFMVGEVGMYGDYFLDFHVPDETVAAYYKDMLTTLDSHDIPWVTGWLVDRYGPVTTYPYHEDREYQKIDGAETYYIDVKMFNMFKEIIESDN